MYPTDQPMPTDDQAMALATRELANDTGSGALLPQGGPGQQLVLIPMAEAEVGEWQERIRMAVERRTREEDKWDVLLKSYLPEVKKGPVNLKVMLHFRNVHTKIGQLFYRSPEVILTPRGPASNPLAIPPHVVAGAPTSTPSPSLASGPAGPPGAPATPPPTAEQTISLKQAVLNWFLGRDGINAVRLMDELLFDVLAWSGLAACKICYRVVTREVPGQVDPATGQPVRVPIHEWWEARRLSPKKLLFNADLHSTRFDEDATWEGMDFYMSPRQAMTEFNLTEDEVGQGAADDDRLYKHDSDSGTQGKHGGMIHGVDLTYKASVFSDEPHPLKMRQLVFLDTVRERPVVHRDSIDQTFDAQGRLTDDSLIGFPYHILTVRDLADSPFPPADSAFTDASQKELSTFRRQKIALRDNAIGKHLYDEAAFGETELDILKWGDSGSYVAVQEGRLAGGGKRILDTTAQVTGTPDDYRTETSIKHDVDETLGIGSTQAGTPESTVRSATEIATVQTAVAGRMAKEQGRAIDFYLGLVRKLDALLMRYATNDEYIAIAGEDGARTLTVWNNQKISGRFLYDIKPDSQLFVDVARDRQQQLTLYNLTGKDPLVNRSELLKGLFRAFGHDPAKAINPPAPPPPPQPDKPNISFAFKGDDFMNPVLAPTLMEILAKAEQLPPPPPMQQPPHGGPMASGSPINQHAAGHSGDVPNGPGAMPREARLHPAQHEAGAPAVPGTGRPM